MTPFKWGTKPLSNLDFSWSSRCILKITWHTSQSMEHTAGVLADIPTWPIWKQQGFMSETLNSHKIDAGFLYSIINIINLDQGAHPDVPTQILFRWNAQEMLRISLCPYVIQYRTTSPISGGYHNQNMFKHYLQQEGSWRWKKTTKYQDWVLNRGVHSSLSIGPNCY